MTEDELDEATFEKILGAAEEIKDMARVRPDNAPAMLAQARHLIELDEQIRNDWLRRQGAKMPSLSLSSRLDGQGGVSKIESREADLDGAAYYLKAPSG